MPPALEAFASLVALELVALPGLEVGGFGEAAFGAEAIEDALFRRGLLEEGGGEGEQRLERCVVEGEALVRPEDGDGGGEPVERRRMALQRARLGGERLGNLGDVDREGSQRSFVPLGGNVENAALALDDGGDAFSQRPFAGAQLAGGVGVEQRFGACRREVGRLGADRAGVGGVHPKPLARLVLDPGGVVDVGDEAGDPLGHRAAGAGPGAGLDEDCGCAAVQRADRGEPAFAEKLAERRALAERLDRGGERAVACDRVGHAGGHGACEDGRAGRGEPHGGEGAARQRLVGERTGEAEGARLVGRLEGDAGGARGVENCGGGEQECRGREEPARHHAGGNVPARVIGHSVRRTGRVAPKAAGAARGSGFRAEAPNRRPAARPNLAVEGGGAKTRSQPINR